MSRSATLTGPGMARSPAVQRRTVRSSTSSAEAAATCDSPSAASAARNSSADNGAVLGDRHAGGSQHGTQAVDRVGGAERVGQRAIGSEQRQAFRAIGAAADEANGVGGQGGDGKGLAHVPCVGPLARHVNNQISAAESPEDTALRAAGPVSPDGRPFFWEDVADFWDDVTSGRVRLTDDEDLRVWRMRKRRAHFWHIAACILATRQVGQGTKISAGMYRRMGRRT
jgi:hypothetical protein